MKTLLSATILGVVILTALAAVAAFGCVFASIGMGPGEDLTPLAGELFAFSRVGFLVALVLIGGYVIFYVNLIASIFESATAEPPAAPEAAPDSVKPPTRPNIEHDD